MTRDSQKFILSISAMALPLLFSGMVLAQDASPAVEMGANAWNNWTKADSGGSGELPAGVENKDYIRCKACHGWDRLGTDGGYVRRDRKETRTNAGDGDGDTTSRAITTGSVTADMITHSGTGRAFTDGTGSWVDLNEMGMHQSSNKAAHSNGYTLGNQHPDFSGGDLTQTQIDNLVAFLNFADGDSSVYFSNVNPNMDPVLYTIVDAADADAGETFYDDTCKFCHGDPATDHQGLNEGHPGGGILAYLAKDGKFSELSHAARWGIPGSVMTRSQLNSPTSANIADMLLYLQKLGGTGFAINSGLSGHWWNGAARDGEGFLFDASLDSAGNIILIATLYTYDGMGNQVWLSGASLPIDGNTTEINLFITEGAMWGADFDKDDVVRTLWGTATFTFTSCSAGHISLVPDMSQPGFTDLEYDINRALLIPDVTCPK